MEKLAKYSGWAGLIALLSGLIVYSLLNSFTAVVYIPLILGILLLLFYVVMQFQEIKKGLTSRSAKFGSNAALMVLIIFGLLVVVNIFSNRFSWRLDTTAARQFSLADQTRNILKNLDQPVQITGFFKSGEEARARELLNEYKHFSDQLRISFTDPDKEPGLAKKYGIKAYGTFVIEANGKEEKVEKSEEESITNAIIKVTRDGKKMLYFVMGHGEKDIDNSEQWGLNTAKTALADENYDMMKIVLAEQFEVPADCAVLVIAGPQSDLFPNERSMIDAYLQRGGKLLLMVDPDAGPSYAALAAAWGFKLGNDVVVDASGLGQLFGAGPTIPIVSEYEQHAITRDFSLMTFYPEARSINRISEDAGGMQYHEIAKTSPRSWAETTPLTVGRINFDAGQDVRGPITLVAAAEKSAATAPPQDGAASKTRLVVFGDSDFASNSYFRIQGNGDFFLNAVSWLAEEEDLISVRARDPEDRRINLTQTQSTLILYIGVILLPLAIFIAGIVVYRKRK